MVSEFTNICSAKMYRVTLSVTLSPNIVCALMNQRRLRRCFNIGSAAMRLISSKTIFLTCLLMPS